MPTVSVPTAFVAIVIKIHKTDDTREAEVEIVNGDADVDPTGYVADAMHALVDKQMVLFDESVEEEPEEDRPSGDLPPDSGELPPDEGEEDEIEQPT